MNVFDLMARISLDTSGYDSGLSNAQSKMGTFASKLGSGLSTIARTGGVLLAGAATAVTGFGISSVKTGQQFDASMSQVAATMGTTVDQIQNLRDFAQEMGASTAFSASQAADALNYMALAGYDAETSMSALPNVLNLAAAGGIDLARASDMVTDVQSALGLTMAESTALIDKMAKASSRTNTSVEQLGDAILTVGGTAKNMAGGTTELAQTLGILADNGIKGAEGGTTLRNMILSLSAPTDAARKKIDKLGLSVFDSEGNMRSMQDIFGDLNGILSTMTQGEQTEVLSEIFNKVDLKGVNALLGTHAERWTELTSTIDSSRGAAKAMADTQLDNLAGDVTLLKSAFEGLQIAVSDGLTPSIREYVQFAGTGLQMITKVLQEEGIGAAFGELGFLIGQLAIKIVNDAPEIVKGALSLLKAVGTALINNIDLILDSVFEIIDILVDTITNESNIRALLNSATKIITKLAAKLTERAPDLIPAAVDMIMALADGLIDNLPEILKAALDLVLALAQGIINAIPELIDRLPELIDSIVTFVLESIPMIIDAGIQLLTSLVSALPEIIEKIVEVLPEIIDGIITALLDNLPLIIEAGITLITALIEDLPTIITTIVEKLPDIIFSIIDAIIAHVPDIINTGMQLFMSLVGALPDIIVGIVTAIGQVLSAVIEAIGRYFTKFKNSGETLIKKIAEGIDKVKTWFAEKWGKIVSDAKEKFTNLVNGAKNWGRDMIQNFVNGITQKFRELKQKVVDVANSVKNVLGFSVPKEGPLSDADTYMPDFMELLAKGIEQRKGVVMRAARDLAEGMSESVMPEVDVGSGLPLSDETTTTSTVMNFNANFYMPESIGSDRERVEWMARELESLMTRRNAYAV